VLPKLWGLANLMRAKPTSVVEQEMASRLEQILNEAFDGSAAEDDASLSRFAVMDLEGDE